MQGELHLIADDLDIEEMIEACMVDIEVELKLFLSRRARFDEYLRETGQT